MTSQEAFKLADRISYRGKDLIIMAAQRVIEQALADACSNRGIAPNSYGAFVVDASAILDRQVVQGYVAWTLDDGEVERAHWALATSGERVIVSRVDTLKRVLFPVNRIFNRA